MSLLHEATAHDDDLSLLRHIVKAGWPSKIQEVPLEIQPYWNFYEWIIMESGLLLK